MTTDNADNRPHLALAKALVFSGQQAEKQKFEKLDALCKRLGIDTSAPEFIKFEQIGRILHREQPEFTRKRRGRRPKIVNIDMERALFVELLQDHNPYLAATSTAKLISALQELEPPLFPEKVDPQRLRNSVSSGRTKLRELGAERKTELKRSLRRK